MTKQERKASLVRSATKFVKLSETEKAFIAGYMARAAEEKGKKNLKKWKKKKKKKKKKIF